MECKYVKEDLKNNVLKQDWHGIKNVWAVSSGGLEPGDMPYLMKLFGNNFVVQLGGGIHGHPAGTLAGARALRQAIDAVLENKNLAEYAKNYVELKAALEHWK